MTGYDPGYSNRSNRSSGERCSNSTMNNTTDCVDIENYGNFENKCNWTLVPKNFMVVCLGDPLDNSKVTSVYLKPIVIYDSVNSEKDLNVYDDDHLESKLMNC